MTETGACAPWGVATWPLAPKGGGNWVLTEGGTEKRNAEADGGVASALGRKEGPSDTGMEDAWGHSVSETRQSHKVPFIGGP